MEQKIYVTTPMFRIEITAEHETEIIKKAAFWLSLPNKCPKCQKPLILNYRTPKTFEYYELKCTGNPSHSVNLGEAKTTHNLYYDTKKEWKTYDPGHVEPDDRTPSSPSATPDPASRSSSDNVDRNRAEIFHPSRDPNRRVDNSPDSAGMANSRNDVIDLITQCNKSQIPPGIGVGDVRDMNGPKLIDEARRLRELLNDARIGDVRKGRQ